MVLLAHTLVGSTLEEVTAGVRQLVPEVAALTQRRLELQAWLSSWVAALRGQQALQR